MTIDASRSVREIVLEIPASASVFEHLGIDYCCGGEKNLDDACQAAGRPMREVLQSLEAARSAAEAETGAADWSQEPLASLMNYIVQRHHTFCRQQISRLEPLLAKVSQAHGRNHPELHLLRSLFSGLSKELLLHLGKEEQSLFPCIARMEESLTQVKSFPQPPFGTVQNPLRMMALEHDNAGAALHEMRNLSGEYRLPPDGCDGYRVLYEGLRAFESDMHQHVHLENNILFPRAVALADMAAGQKGAPAINGPAAALQK